MHKLLNKLRKFFTPTDTNWITEVDTLNLMLLEKFPDRWPGVIPSYSELCTAFGLKYKPDTLFTFIPWDYQFDSIETIKRGGGDCNSLHRIIQVMYHIKGYKAYLAFLKFSTWKWHATCLIKSPFITNVDPSNGMEDMIVDYDTIIIGKNPKELLDNLAIKYYNSPLKEYYLESIDWKIGELL